MTKLSEIDAPPADVISDEDVPAVVTSGWTATAYRTPWGQLVERTERCGRVRWWLFVDDKDDEGGDEGAA